MLCDSYWSHLQGSKNPRKMPVNRWMPYYTGDGVGSDCLSKRVKKPSKLLECEVVTKT
jgi:hypothetical protein